MTPIKSRRQRALQVRFTTAIILVVVAQQRQKQHYLRMWQRTLVPIMSPEPRYTVVFPSLYLSSTPVTEKEGEFIALLHNSVVFYESSPDDGQLTPLRLESGVKCVSGA